VYFYDDRKRADVTPQEFVACYHIASIMGGIVMPQILVRNLEPEVVERLKERATIHGHSLQAEVAQILRQAARTKTMAEARAISDQWMAYWGDRKFSDSAELIREDRER